MGACCSGKEGRGDHREELCTRYTKPVMIGEAKYTVPKMEVDIEKSGYSQMLTSLIIKYQDRHLKLRKMCLEEVWNVCRFYKDDYSVANYILYDFRNIDKRAENFLKKFRTINYSFEEMQFLNENSINNFRKYLNEKKIIIVCPEEKLDQIELFLHFVVDKKVNCSLLFLDVDLENEYRPFYKTNLELLDLKWFKEFPFLLLSMRHFPHLRSNSMIFIDILKNNSPNKFSHTSITEGKGDDHIIKLINTFKISTTLIVKGAGAPAGTMLECKSKRLDVPLKTLSLVNIVSSADMIRDKFLLLSLINNIKYEILSSRSILLQIEEFITNETLMQFLLLAIWKITDVPVFKLKDYICENFLFIKNAKELCNQDFAR